ncbi:C40 family peptidase [Streptomyces sp. SID8352]|uniref:C40 family peptidase n=1 Tax=Streptomyces sp. SID8352 TaxID=2690338 RepID=UPI00136BABE9|nr:C40 family peptidase [Streptomyces sp. SID8352]MYU24642.1 hypothetical protein [Streptomyces sp. SID8352]
MDLLLVQDDRLHVNPPAALTTSVVPGPPQLLQVSDARGLLATLTVGARTVTMRGQQRTFTEQKRPFADTFQRTTTAGWGPSPGGGTWSNSNGTDADYTVTPGRGLISVSAENASRHTSLVNDISDLDARLSWSMDKPATGNASSLALSFAYTSSTSQYRARLSVLTSGTVQLVLECQTSAGTTTIGALTTVGTGYVAGDIWHIRAQRAGTTLRCRAWKDGATEPGTWTHEVVDTSLGAGRIGVRAFASAGSTAIPILFRVHEIQLYSGTWPSTPTVTHNTWVRILATPFDGTWTPALADQIRAWAVDTTPDALAHAMAYITGALVVMDSRMGGGVQVAGQAMYGPNAADGTRREGADWHEYMGMPWTYPNGESKATSPEWRQCMDCSGYVRMVYGYHLGIPMVRDRDFDGINLPRRTRDIGPSGPGIVVAQAASAPPPLANLRIGDVPLFDADSGDATSGQIDHNGIFIGIDQNGRYRFLNSRKTPNGPTMGDLGGTSILDGTGLYATSLRIIRRF